MRARCGLWIALTIALAMVVIAARGSTGAGLAEIPDFSGIWAHPYLTGFEPPASGAGPIVNRSRRNGTGNFQQLVGDFTSPILKPAAAEIVRQHGEISLAGKGYPTPSNQCWPGGVPYVFWDFLMQMFQEGDRITMVYRQGNEMRHVRLNAQHPPAPTPSWYGDSVGRYEGDTLVIDTVAIKVGPFAMVDMYGTPHSDKLHVVERYRLIDLAEAKRERWSATPKRMLARLGRISFDANYRGKALQLGFYGR